MNTIQPITRRMILAGSAALVVGGVAARVVAAEQTAAPTGNGDVIVFSTGSAADPEKHRAEWTQALANKLGVSVDRLQQAIQDTTKEVGFAPPLLATPPLAGVPGGFSLKIESPFASAAKVLGMTEDQLKTEQAAGKSLADIARARNVDPKVVGDAIKAQRQADIDKAVANGGLPKDVADRIKSHIDDEVDHILQVVPSGPNGVFSIRLEQSLSTNTGP